MDEILKRLLETELLSEETKLEITAEWEASVATMKEAIRESTILEVRTELSEQWITEREELTDKLDAFVEARLAEELSELKSDIERFRDLEAEYASKLVDEKRSIAEELSVELDTLADKVDSFMEVRINEEMQELKEDLVVARENEFGRKIFEAFVSEFGNSFVDEASLQSKLSITEDKLTDAQARIAEMETKQAKIVRESKMEKILSALTGSKREQMTFILQNVETSKLEEAYKMFIGRVLKEEAAPVVAVSEVIAEEVKSVEDTVLVTGDIKEVAPVVVGTQHSAELTKALRLAGVRS